MNYHKNLTEFPKDAHFAALVEDSFSYTDSYDQASYYNSLNYITFSSESELEKWVVENETKGYSKKKFQIIRVEPVSAKLSFKLDLK